MDIVRVPPPADIYEIDKTDEGPNGVSYLPPVLPPQESVTLTEKEACSALIGFVSSLCC